ncbi:MAG: anaerobic glycerol-3-phosphate dehydrogenase subunit B [Candidatus Thorarchaeota archaeon]|nr:anaerobic glycerol-3-phosphate dehydrogenase subunit B [Candidatus Thorarchaeota archaeon]
MVETDVLVIGGGMAGLVAGASAAQRGCRVLLIRKGEGATSMSSGAIDVLGYMPGGHPQFGSASEGLAAFPEAFPLHPYCVAGANWSGCEESADGIKEVVKESIDWFKSHINGPGLQFIGSMDANLLPLTVLGTRKPTCLVQDTMYSKSIETESDHTVLFAGVRGHPEFNPVAAARSYISTGPETRERPKKTASCTVGFSPRGGPCNISSIELARHLDLEGTVLSLVDALRPHVEQVGATHVALPPVLGIRNARRNRETLEREMGVTVFELLSFPPSVPGLRLQLALEALFGSAGGNILSGFEAVRAKKEDKTVVTVTCTGPRRVVEVSAKSVVLATGKYIGGGIRVDERGAVETAFGITPVTKGFYSAAASRAFDHTTRVALPYWGQPVFSIGLVVDSHFRPVNPDGTVVAHNLFAAGALLSGYNYSSEKSGLGVAMVTGRRAGLNSSQLGGVD